MSTTIESLELEIKSNSTSAVAGIEALAQSLEKLKTTTKGGLGLSSIAKQMGALNTATNGIKSDSIENVKGLVDAIQLLSSVKLSGTIGKNIASISDSLKGVDIGAFGDKILEVTAAVRPLATEMDKVARGFAAFPSRIQGLISSTDKIPQSNKKASKSFTELYSAMKLVIGVGKTAYNIIRGMVDKSSDYIEQVHLFNVSMGEYTSEAMEYGKQVSEVLGIDLGEWLHNQGIFQTLATGFGVAGDKASVMSKNLTQLGYDISSFHNIDVEDAMEKLQSGLAGELEPLRRIGYDLSQAKLEATAMALGIDKSVSSMTQAEKAMLRYHAIMTQVTTVHGDMAATIESPANQMRVLKAQFEMLSREIGEIFIPIVNKVLTYFIAIIKVAREVVSVLGRLFGAKATTLSESLDVGDGVGALVEGTEEAEDAMENATTAAKKLKSYMMGFDELNVIDPNTDSSSSGSGADTSTSAFDIDLPEYTADFLGVEMESRVNQIVEDMKEWLGITGEINSWADLFDTKLGDILIAAGGIGAAILAWKMSGSFTSGIANLSTVLGLGILIDSLDTIWKEGLSIEESIKGAIGGALAGLGLGFKFGGWKGAIGGLMIGLGVSMIIQGITSMLSEGVTTENIVAVVSGVLATATGLITTIKLFNKNNKSPIKDFNTTADTIDEVSVGANRMGTTTSKLTTTLKSVAKNLALGVVILAEVAAVAILIVGAIVVLGKELEQVGIAWKPVLENGETVGIAMGLGTGILVAIGVAAGLLGTVGSTLIANIALGIAMLALIGASAVLFIAEILVIGVLLDEVGKAWQPVLDQGDTISTAIGLGSAILLAIGVAAAALGVLAVASCGLLPLAIGLGTAMLLEIGVAAGLFITEIIVVGGLLDELGKAWQPVLDKGDTVKAGIERGSELLKDIGLVAALLGALEIGTFGLADVAIGLGTDMLVKLSKAFIKFTESLIEVSTQLRDELHPELEKSNEILPLLSENMTKFTEFMAGFAGNVVDYSMNNSIASIAATIDTIIGFFTTDPVTKMYNEVSDQNDEFDALITELEEIIPKIEHATDLTGQYNVAMGDFEEVSGNNKGLLGNLGIVKGAINSIIAGIERLSNGVISGINGMINSLNSLSFEIPDWVPAIGGKKFGLNLRTINTISIPRFAEGGFPEQGQMFIAREAGPEIVGNIGRRTAVANNEQIVESVASGVAEANSEQNMLLREQNSLLRALLEKDTGTYLDGRSLSESVDKYRRQQGRVLITGGAL